MGSLSSDQLARLSPEERLALIGELWDSLSDADVPLPEAQQAELSRRLSSLDQDLSQSRQVGRVARRVGSTPPVTMQVVFTPPARAELVDDQDW
jgi:putative addiction module component (TIGR02574 family)